MTYADASILVSLNLRDTNSAAAVAYVKAQRPPLDLTALQRHELRNALRLAVFRTRTCPVPVSEADARTALAQIDADINSGNLVTCSLSWSETLTAAERLGGAHTTKLGVREMDLLNVAAAVATKAKVFLTFDLRQRAIAQAYPFICRSVLARESERRSRASTLLTADTGVRTPSEGKAVRLHGYGSGGRAQGAPLTAKFSIWTQTPQAYGTRAQSSGR